VIQCVSFPRLIGLPQFYRPAISVLIPLFIFWR
jgi:hypothetical protein